jgi:predicted nucleotidyltransferase
MKHKKIIEKVKDSLLERDDLLAIILHGSFVHGDFKPTSDLDFIVIVTSPLFQREKRMVDGVKVEIFYRDYPGLVRELMVTRMPLWTRQLARGKILYTKNDLVPGLQELAKKYYLEGPRIRPPDFWSVFLYEAEEYLNWTKDNSHRVAVLYLLNTLFQRSLAASFNLERKWEPKWSRLLPTIRQEAPDLYEICEKYLLTSQVPEKVTALRKIFEYLDEKRRSLAGSR